MWCIKGRNIYIIWTGKPDGEKPIRRHRSRWEDIIKMDLWEIGFEGMHFIHMAQDRDWLWALLNIVVKLWVP
jgi:hypothetical protein